MSAAFLPNRFETTLISSGCDTKSAIICAAPIGLFNFYYSSQRFRAGLGSFAPSGLDEFQIGAVSKYDGLVVHNPERATSRLSSCIHPKPRPFFHSLSFRENRNSPG